MAAFRWCKEYGIKTRAYMMVGLPEEHGYDTQKSFDFINALEPDDTMISPTIIYPDTQLMEYAIKHQKITPNAWSQYTLGKSQMPYYIPDGYTQQAIEENNQTN
jgi:hypothetical protein